MAETGPELEPEDDIRYAFPEVAPAATEPADILGLRLNAHSETRARHPSKPLLGGTCDASEGDLHFRWPNSPLTIAVQLDANRPEGPVAIEVGASLRIDLPEGPHPVLGASFVRISRPESC
jgi:hypothetical protein